MLKKNINPIDEAVRDRAKSTGQRDGVAIGISKKELEEDQEQLGEYEMTQVNEANGAAASGEGVAGAPVNTARRLLNPNEMEGCEHEPAEIKRGDPNGEFDNDWKLTYKLSLRAENLQYSKLLSYMEKWQPLNPETHDRFKFCSTPIVLDGLLNRLFNPFYCCLVNSNRNGQAKGCCARKNTSRS